MDPLLWLDKNASGFAQLSEDERNAIFCFTFLWSYFEAKALGTDANSDKIRSLTEYWDKHRCLNAQVFSNGLLYVRNRYSNNGTLTTSLFSALFPRNDRNKLLVEQVVLGQNTNPAEEIAGLLIIVYRLRNNLFHGTKWVMGISGQLDNFANANLVLVKALDTHGSLPPIT